MSTLRARWAAFALTCCGLVGCGAAIDGTDAAHVDGAPPDASPFDASLRDAGRAIDAGPNDAGPNDAGPNDAGPNDAGPPPGTLLYETGALHSPVSAEVVASLADIRRTATLDENALMKVGDSITVARTFLQCFENDVSLPSSLRTTRARFEGSYRRTSLAATVGWSSFAALEGDPNPVEQEHVATRARYATLMFGSNDAGFRAPQAFARDLWRIAEQLVASGTVPLMSTIPPRDDSPEADARVPLYNLAVRAIAQGLRVPLVDFHSALLPLPEHGLSADGVHPRAHGDGCVFDEDGLDAGYNVRNQLTLEQLDRATRTETGAALDLGELRMTGQGTAEAPFAVPTLPFAAMGDSRDGDLGIDVYGCASADESGPARIYRIETTRRGTLHAFALSDRNVDVDVHILTALDAAACVARDDTTAQAELDAGVHYVVVDTYVGSAARPGRFLVAAWLE